MTNPSPRLRLPMIAPSQAQKHVTHNEAIADLDILVQLAVIEFDRTEPPADPRDGDAYVLGPDPTGDWAGQGGRLAGYRDGGWSFWTPLPGWLAWDLSGDQIRVCSETGGFVPAAMIGQVESLGINAAADAANRLVVSAASTLLTHDGTDHRLTLNRASASDTASVVLQSNWSGRAELGLAGSDDFSVKVSEDGTTWREGLGIDAASGTLRAPSGIDLSATPSADPRVLDAYLEGTWSPMLTGSDSAPSGTVATATAAFVKIGRVVHLTFSIAVTDIGSGGTGAARVSGLPFAATTSVSAGLHHPGISSFGPLYLRFDSLESTLLAADGREVQLSELGPDPFELSGSLFYMSIA